MPLRARLTIVNELMAGTNTVLKLLSIELLLFLGLDTTSDDPAHCIASLLEPPLLL